MRCDFTIDERLIEPLLRQTDRASDDVAPGKHVDDEMLAMFAEGASNDEERSDVMGHLAECPSCRQAASLLLSLSAQTTADVRPARPFLRLESRMIWAAAAASILLVFGLILWVPQEGPQIAENRIYGEVSELLREGRFAEAQGALNGAAGRGIQSGRLRSLQSQAILEIPSPIALESAGRLTDFGFEIGGVVARSTTPAETRDKRQQAYAILAEAGAEQVEVLLNRGHVLLGLDRPADALEEFSRLTSSHPDEPLAWLGVGLAHYVLEDYAAAEKGFRQCLRLDPANATARMNLAMTLEEQGRLEEALEAWEAVPLEARSQHERESIRAEMDELREHLNTRE